MIPEFPEFKPLELSDKEEIEAFTKKFPPYSDFNFVSMWSWDIHEGVQLSWLKGNLVVKFTDYLTGRPFLSFLGNKNCKEVAGCLLEHASSKDQLHTELAFVPEHTVPHLDQSSFLISEDPDHFDYIFDLQEIAGYAGSKFSSKRNKVNKFTKTVTNCRVVFLDIHNETVQNDIRALNKEWLFGKKTDSTMAEFEVLALEKFFAAKFDDNIVLGVYCDEKLIAYSVSHILGEFAISHFTKASREYSGLFEYLMRENARVLLEHSCKYLNFEQDLGLAGLRESKKSFHSFFLKKYLIKN